MNTKLLLCAGLFMTANTAFAQLAERPKPVAPDSNFVPVSLNALANNRSTLDAPSAQVSVANIPLELARSGENNNLFLEKAGWPDWKSDPLDFYAAYDSAPKEPTDTMPVAPIPTDDYSAVWVLAACENDAKYSNILSFRIGAKQGFAQTTYRDFEFQIPRAADKTGANVVQTLPVNGGNVFLLRLPLNAALRQDFSNHRTLDVEITKQLRLSVTKPDAARFQYRPLGLPSGVHLYGLTFERAPLRLALESTQPGNVFNEPQTPSLALKLQPIDAASNLKVRAKAVDYDGKTITFPDEVFTVGAPAALAEFQRTIKLPVSRRGYYALTIAVESGGKTVLEKQTTFALLPKNTRTHRAQSPFGTWDFGGTHYTPSEAELVGPLYEKAGLRYGMFSFTKAERERYGVLRGNDPAFNSGTDLAKIDDIIAEVKKSGEIPTRWMLFHEDIISGDHVTRTPDLFSGKPYRLNADEQKKLDAMVKMVLVAAPKLRKAFPGIQIHLGNGMPHLMEEFLRQKLPPETFDALGNEAASFARLPESQPTDFVANNPSLWMENELLKHYGYTDKTVEQAYEIMYPSTNSGNLTLRQQANYMVRNLMHSLAWKVPVIRFGLIADAGNSYYFGNWGASGLMFGRPNVSPKPSYVATATTTQMLDGARFSRQIPTGTSTVYAFEFSKPDGTFVTCLWTPNAARGVLLTASQPKLTVTDVMGNDRVLPLPNGHAELLATADPVFIESAKPLIIQAQRAIEAATPQWEYSVISKLDDAAQWQIVNGDNDELESYNFAQPRLEGKFAMQTVADFEGRKNVLEVKPISDDGAMWWLPRYTQLVAKIPLGIKGEPTHIGLMVNGNGGWGRIIFELEDAAGQRWISLGTEQGGAPNPWLADWMSKDEFSKLKSSGVSDWNSNDLWGHSMINFAGWQNLQFPLPGNYPGEGYHWPSTSQWRCVKSDGAPGDYIVHYPLKVTKLAVTARPKVLYGNEVLPVRRPEIYLQNLGVSYGDPDSAFWKPDAGQK
jgi:hypothetical protein